MRFRNGHPLVGVSWWSRLSAELADREIGITFIEGISSITSVYHALRRDPIECGVTIVDANRLLLFEYDVSNELDLLGLDICSTGTRRTHLSDPSRENQWSVLCNFCRDKYGESHNCFLVFAAMNPGMSSEVVPLNIAELPGCLDQLRFGTSLLIPAIGTKQVSVPSLRGLLGLQE